MRSKSGFVFLALTSVTLFTMVGCQSLQNLWSTQRLPMTSERCVANIERERILGLIICDEATKDDDELKCKQAANLLADLSLPECAQFPSIEDLVEEPPAEPAA